jgi:predicted metal-binding membrane protein
VSEPTGSRADLRRQRRRAQVRRTAVLLGLLLVVAVAFAVWLALDAPAPPGRAPGRD